MYHKDRFSLFDENQLNACALFVKFCAYSLNENLTDSYFAKDIYENYWVNYENKI